MNRSRHIHWGRVVVAGFLAEATVLALFFVLLFGTRLIGYPDIAKPFTPLDYADAMISSFLSIFLFTLWVGKRIQSDFVLHGVLVGAVSITIFVVLIYAINRTFAEPPLYVVAHFLKILGGIAGGLVVQKRKGRIAEAGAPVSA